jgi:nitrogenase-associated protein
MSKVVFYEKPGCSGNARQKALLVASGHELDVRNLLAEPWTAAELRLFFGDKPVSDWFNTSAPRVKSGEVKPGGLTPDQALAMMVDDPLLIRRPLMRVGERREAGFDQATIDAWIGLRTTQRPVTDACLKTAATHIPQPQPFLIAALQGASSAALQDLIGLFAARVAGQGVKVGGVVETADHAPGGGGGKLAVRDLWTGAVISISQDLGPGSTACSLAPSGLAEACFAVQTAIAAGAELIILSKFGKIEAQRGGLIDAFAASIDAGLPILTAVSPSVSDAWRRFSGPLAQVLPADLGAVEAWWSEIRPRAPAPPARGGG